MGDNIERRELYQMDNFSSEDDTDYYVKQVGQFASSGQSDLSTYELIELQGHLADAGLLSPNEGTIDEESLRKEFHSLGKMDEWDDEKKKGFRNVIENYVLLCAQEHQELVNAQKVEKRSVLQSIKDKVLNTLGNIAPEKVPAIIFRTVGTLSLLTGTACQTITEAKAPVEETPVSSTIPDDLVVDETPTDVEIEVPTQTVTPEVSETVEAEETTQTPEVIPTSTPTEVITSVPTEEFRRDFTEEEALEIFQSMLESENLKVKQEREIVNKMYAVEPEQLYLSKMFSIKEKQGIIENLLLDRNDEYLEVLIEYKRTIVDEEGDILTIGFVSNTGMLDSRNLDCDKLSTILSIQKSDGTRYDFAKETNNEVLVVPIGFFNFGTLTETQAMSLVFEKLALGSYKKDEVKKLSEMIDYNDPGFNQIKRLYGGRWGDVAMVANHISGVLTEAGLAEEIDRYDGGEKRYSFTLESMTFMEREAGAASLRVENGEQIGDIVLKFKENVNVEVSIFSNKQQGSVFAVVRFIKDGEESEGFNVNTGTIKNIIEMPERKSDELIWGKPKKFPMY